MASEKFFIWLLRAGIGLLVLTTGLLIYVYTCQTVGPPVKFQAWSTFALCVTNVFIARRQLLRRKRK